MSRARSKRTGRRSGTSRTRDEIAAAARMQFAEHGYEAATFRGIATAAGVDPALVVHFYGSKEDLFREVMQLPPAVSDALVGVAQEPREQMGQRLAELVIAALENPATRPVLLGRIRSASSNPVAAGLVREMVTRDLSALTQAIGGDRPDERAVLLGAQVVGIALARYVVRVEPLASLPLDDVIELVAPAFQHYLAEPLTDR
ncbi:MAG TPA: TetR family transcriptional regulator [Gaiellaceae bacterium]|nr:TetR family transcriptional regulator [Gaiellaceae bacterium]